MKKYIVPMIKAKMLIEESDLLAASPAFGGDSGVTGGSEDDNKPGYGTGGQANHFNVWGDDEE